jgi:hypothetical protein
MPQLLPGQPCAFAGTTRNVESRWRIPDEEISTEIFGRAKKLVQILSDGFAGLTAPKF